MMPGAAPLLPLVGRLSLRGRLERCYETLSLAPLNFSTPAPANGRAWAMFLEDPPNAQQQGIYSTSFAIQLLARSPDPTDHRVIAAITGGVRFLLDQRSQ